MKNIVALLATIMLCAAPQVVARSRHDARVELGRRLFYDADLSRDGTMSCATCHEQRHGFADGNRVHPGVTDEPGRRNVPGLANVGHFSPLTWADPRQTTLERQAAVPVFGTHPVEMGMAGMQADRGRIRTPSLRNVAVTAPYWHDGSALTLDDAIARHGLALAPTRSRALAAFLGALTDDRFLNNPAFSLPQTACGMKL